MLLTGYHMDITRPECNHSFQSVHCIAHLDTDVGKALPYVNATLGGSEYIEDPPSVTLRAHGKLITVHARQIFINALRDEIEAERILKWLQKEINEAWRNRDQIEPRFEGAPKPQMLKILKLLPKTNCRDCGAPTCMVFAVRLGEGGVDPEDCPSLSQENLVVITNYLKQFNFDY